MKPEIGVVVPTLNSAATLEWTLCSLRAQQGCVIKVVVADSGSSDGTVEICKKWEVQTIYVPPGNMYKAINAGLRTLSSKWVTYLNSDDVVYPNSYARLLAAGELEEAALVYGDCDYMDEEGRFLFTRRAVAPRRQLGLFRRGVQGFAQPSAIFLRMAFRQLGPFSESFRHIGDYDFFYRVIASKLRITSVGAPSVAAFRLHRTQLSTREAHLVAAEKNAHRHAQGTPKITGGRFDLLHWRLINSKNYLDHFLRNM